MKIKIEVPSVGESVTQADIESWAFSDGDFVEKDQVLAILETDKASMEIPAPDSGTLQIVKPSSSTVSVGELIAYLETSSAPSSKKLSSEKTSSEKNKTNLQSKAEATIKTEASPTSSSRSDILSPAAKRIVAENNIDPSAIQGTGKDGRLSKQDVLKTLEQKPITQKQKTNPTSAPLTSKKQQGQKREKMSNLRRRIAERLVQSQHNAATLSTFNEVDMSRIIKIRKLYQDQFIKKHGVKLGFMSFFVKAVTSALKAFPKINAFIDEADIVYNDSCHIGVAVSTDKGLLVPVLFNAEELSLASIEKQLIEYRDKAINKKLTPDDLIGGTFTISNGGVFGSLLSTPILNPPQSGILGMHKIEQRPVVVDNKIEIKPMMYLSLSYDHRIVDGKESVSFLVKVKEALEEPASLLIDV